MTGEPGGFTMATKKGDDGDNTLVGTAGNDLIYGYGGDDVITGGRGIDRLSGGAGRDTFVFARGDGQDTITDFAGGDRIDLRAFGIASFDVLKTYYLSPFNFGTSFGFRNNGEAWSLFLENVNPDELKASNFILDTSKTARNVKDTGGDDDLFGGLGNDRISAGGGADRMSGGGGNDTFVFAKRQFSYDAILDLSRGDRIDLSGLGVSDFEQVRYVLKLNGTGTRPGFRISMVYGGAEETIEVNTIGLKQPTAAEFVFTDGKQADQVRGTASNDVLFGGRGASTLSGGDGADTLLGGAGDDVLDGGSSSDTLMLGDGRDRAVFAERVFGGDRILDFEAGDIIDLAGVGVGDFSTIAPFLRQGFGETTLFLGVGSTITLDGVRASMLDANDFAYDPSTRARRIEDSDYDNFLIGGAGDDRLSGNGGHDTLTAGKGNDTLIGGGGLGDLLYGGAGADTFVYLAVGDALPGSAGNIDVIGDFSHAEHDKIDLSKIDAIAATAKNDAFTFVGTDKFSGTAGEVRYTVSHGDAHVYVATETSGYQMEFVLTGVTELVASDFVL